MSAAQIAAGVLLIGAVLAFSVWSVAAQEGWRVALALFGVSLLLTGVVGLGAFLIVEGVTA